MRERKSREEEDEEDVEMNEMAAHIKERGERKVMQQGGKWS